MQGKTPLYLLQSFSRILHLANLEDCILNVLLVGLPGRGLYSGTIPEHHIFETKEQSGKDTPFHFTEILQAKTSLRYAAYLVGANKQSSAFGFLTFLQERIHNVEHLLHHRILS